jgi:hypothetical protein
MNGIECRTEQEAISLAKAWGGYWRDGIAHIFCERADVTFVLKIPKDNLSDKMRAKSVLFPTIYAA